MVLSRSVTGPCRGRSTRAIPDRYMRSVAAIDGLLAATAGTHGLVVATRKVTDFLPTGVPLFNPWTGEWHNR